MQNFQHWNEEMCILQLRLKLDTHIAERTVEKQEQIYVALNKDVNVSRP